MNGKWEILSQCKLFATGKINTHVSVQNSPKIPVCVADTHTHTHTYERGEKERERHGASEWRCLCALLIPLINPHS